MKSLMPQNSATSVQYAAPLEQLKSSSTGSGVASWTACFVTVHDHRVCVYDRPPVRSCASRSSTAVRAIFSFESSVRSYEQLLIKGN